MVKCPECGYEGIDTGSWIHPVQVGEKFAQYDYKPGQEEDHELWGEKVTFSYYYRPTESVVQHKGLVTDLGGRHGGLYWIRVKTDRDEREFDLDDIGVVRSPARSRAHLGPLTALEFE